MRPQLPGGGSMHPVAKVRRKPATAGYGRHYPDGHPVSVQREAWNAAYNGPGTTLEIPKGTRSSTLVKLAAKRKAERENDAAARIQEVRARKGTGK